MWSTTRRQPSGPRELHLDFDAPIGRFSIPEGIRSACIFVTVARLAACEADPNASGFVNISQTMALVDRLAANGIYTLFLSTNQVFDGESPHVRADAPASPRSEYGRQKAETERQLRAHTEAGDPIGILRLAKVVSPGMALLSDWKRALAAGRTIHLFSDMRMAPTPIDIVASLIAQMMQDCSPFIAQLSGPRDITYAEAGRFLASRIGADPRLVEPVSACDAGVPRGATPRHTTLDSSAIASKYGSTVPDAFEVIARL
ncbi:MAG TPA: sugar nucleotide-binding protein [Bradyrhizobium sp.]|nr:sugar nucleotide-binding protein [Bradyrhizobium sp.]